MCGIAGFVHKDDCDSRCKSIEDIFASLQACRGPDACKSQVIRSSYFTVHLSHQRLRIQDLSCAADQPMQSQINRNAYLIFNGEIYNVEEVRNAFIADIGLRTHSDTEVLLESLVSQRIDRVLQQIRGMFAFGYLNASSSLLTLARDRFGEKPLHFHFDNDTFIFASQFDAVTNAMRILEKPIELDLKAISEYLLLGYFPYDQSLVKDVQKLAPGNFLEVNFAKSRGVEVKIGRWIKKWKAREIKSVSFSDARRVIKDAVAGQLVGDVPVGVFLSGGCDSTLISMLAQEVSTSPIHSFSIGFENPKFDESQYALQASSSIGTIHHAITMSGKDALEILPLVLDAYPEPLGDPSTIPTTFLCREARKYVTVVLTGDGADELFFGYGRYARFKELERVDLLIPRNQKFREFLAKIIARNSVIGPKNLRAKRIESFISNDHLGMSYGALVGFPHVDVSIDSEWNSSIRREQLKRLWMRGNAFDSVSRLREIDVDSYLTDDILVKVDRASMRFSLEARSPFLDTKVADLAASCGSQILHTFEQKHILKAILAERIEDKIFRRPKMGFGPPLLDWFNSDLNSWASELIYGFDWESIQIDSGKVYDLWERRNANTGSVTFIWMLTALANSIRKIYEENPIRLK